MCNASRLNIMWNDVYMSYSKAVKNGDEENDEGNDREKGGMEIERVCQGFTRGGERETKT